jgi:hypothetical protein
MCVLFVTGDAVSMLKTAMCFYNVVVLYSCTPLQSVNVLRKKEEREGGRRGKGGREEGKRM